jgi:hypothetical protein
MRNLLQYAPNAFRVGTLALCVGNAVLAVAVKVNADTGREGMLNFGRSLLQYVDGQALSRTRTLSLNGAQLKFATGTTNDSVEHVANFYARGCNGRSGGLGEQVQEFLRQADRAQQSTGAAANEIGEIPFTTFKTVADSEGIVFCLDMGAQRVSMAEFLARIRRATETGDLSAVGGFRYVYISRDSTPNARTHVVGYWSDGSASLNLTRMFPVTGDAPGRDVPQLPRPAGLRRTLSAYELGTAYSYNVYEGFTPRARVEEQLRTQLVRDGWTLIPLRHPRTRENLQGQNLLTFERGAANVMYVLGEENGRTSLATFAQEASAILR